MKRLFIAPLLLACCCRRASTTTKSSITRTRWLQTADTKTSLPFRTRKTITATTFRCPPCPRSGGSACQAGQAAQLSPERRDNRPIGECGVPYLRCARADGLTKAAKGNNNSDANYVITLNTRISTGNSFCILLRSAGTHRQIITQ